MFVSVKFREADTRTYTYTTDLPLAAGDRVMVDVKGEPKVVFVADVELPEPAFACKQIVGMAPPKEEPAAIGHNNPPDPLDEITAPFDDYRREAENWLDGKPVENEAQMDAVDGLRKQMRSWRLALEAGQKDATAPLHDIYKAELERWKPTIADAKLIETGLVALVDGFKRKLAAEKELARKAAWEASEKARRDAEALVAQANAGDLAAQREAQAAMDAADLARVQASAAQKDVVRGMRTVHKWEFVDEGETSGRRLALNWIAANDRDAITAFIDGYVAKNFKDKAIAGVRTFTEKEAY